MNIAIIFFSFIVSAMASPTASAAGIIVNKSVPSVELTLDDTRAIFAMRKRFWPNGKQIIVFALTDSSPVHKDFVKKNLIMFPHQLRRVWDRMIYAGTGEAPIQLDSEQDMIDKIANTPDSIGYIKNRPKNEKIRLFEYK